MSTTSENGCKKARRQTKLVETLKGHKLCYDLKLLIIDFIEFSAVYFLSSNNEDDRTSVKCWYKGDLDSKYTIKRLFGYFSIDRQKKKYLIFKSVDLKIDPENDNSNTSRILRFLPNSRLSLCIVSDCKICVYGNSNSLFQSVFRHCYELYLDNINFSSCKFECFQKDNSTIEVSRVTIKDCIFTEFNLNDFLGLFPSTIKKIAISLFNVSSIRSETIEFVAKSFSHLRSLVLHGPLRIRSGFFNIDHLESSRTIFSSLKMFSLSGGREETHIYKTLLNELSKIGCLTVLNLVNNEFHEDDFINVLIKLENLRRLNLSGSVLESGDLGKVEEKNPSRHLDCLTLDEAYFESSFLVKVSKICSIGHLSIDSRDVTIKKAIFEIIPSIRITRALSVGRINSNSLKPNPFGKREILYKNIMNRGGKESPISNICLTDSSLEEEIIQNFMEMSHLQSIEISCKVSAETISKMAKSNLKKIVFPSHMEFCDILLIENDECLRLSELFVFCESIILEELKFVFMRKQVRYVKELDGDLKLFLSELEQFYNDLMIEE